MTFENTLQAKPSLRSQLVDHLPVLLLVLGVAGAFVALHLALAGVVALALLHVIGGAAIMAFRRHRSGSASQ